MNCKMKTVSSGAFLTYSETDRPIEIAFRTSAGNRYQQNQDAVLFAGEVHQGDARRAALLTADTPRLIAITDGVAVGPCAALAARTVLSLLYANHLNGDPLDTGLVRRVQSALADVGITRCHGMASTLVALEISDGHVRWVSVGDSRAYRMRAGCLTQMTTDHTLRARLQADAEEAIEDFSATAWDGLDSCLIASHDEAGFAISHGTDSLKLGDVWLLCSDGVTATVSDELLASMITTARELGDCCDLVVEAAIADVDNDDNISVLMARVGE